MAKAQAALDNAEREHEQKAAAIRAEAEALEKLSRVDDERGKERERLQAALPRTRD